MKEWYAAALEEVWRHEESETAIRRVGTLLADYRRTAS
jgi:hypothetical protein